MSKNENTLAKLFENVTCGCACVATTKMYILVVRVFIYYVKHVMIFFSYIFNFNDRFSANFVICWMSDKYLLELNDLLINFLNPLNVMQNLNV